MSISGNLEDVSVADVLQFVHLGRRSGRLSLVRDGEEVQILFESGRLVGAEGSAGTGLGDILLAEGLVSPEELAAAQLELAPDSAGRRPEPSSEALAEALVRRRSLDAEALHQARRRQKEAAVSAVLDWSRGSFEFYVEEGGESAEEDSESNAGPPPLETVSDLDVETQMMLIRAAKRRRTESEGRGGSEEAREDPGEATHPGDETHPGDQTHPVPPGPDDTTVDFMPAYRTRMLPMDALPGPPESTEDTRPEPIPLMTAEPVEGTEGALEAVAEAGVRYAPGAEGGARVRLVTEDTGLFEALSAALPPSVELVERIPLEAAAGVPPEASPVVVADLRQALGPAQIRDLRQAHPEVPVLAIQDPDLPPTAAYAAGAVAVIPPDPEAVAACLVSVLDLRATVAGGSAAATAMGRKLSRLHQSTRDLRSGFSSVTVALQLLQLLADSAERAVLFLRREDRLRALGAFGDALEGAAAPGEPLAAATRGLELEVGEPLGELVAAGEARLVEAPGPELPDELLHLLGPPAEGRSLLLPVHGAEAWISLIYADNGASDEPLGDLIFLELAADQIGVALENEQLRRREPDRH